MAPEELYFDPIREGRGWYFVEYYPPRPTEWWATLSIQVSEPATDAAIAAAMESELETWLRRYSVPLHVCAFDQVGDLCQLEGKQPLEQLTGCLDDETGETRLVWQSPGDEEAPGKVLDNRTLLRVYEGIPYKTPGVSEREFKTWAQSVRIGRWLVLAPVFIWVVVAAPAWALAQWASPRWVGTLVLLYCFAMAFVKALKLSGKWKPSPRKLQARDRERRMEDYYYHCERNPEGFERLKVESVERDVREQIQNEARELRDQSEPARDPDDPGPTE